MQIGDMGKTFTDQCSIAPVGRKNVQCAERVTKGYWQYTMSIKTDRITNLKTLLGYVTIAISWFIVIMWDVIAVSLSHGLRWRS